MMEKSEVVIDLEISQEIQRLEELYGHYKGLYRRMRLLCCSEGRGTVKRNRDHYKEKLKEMKELQISRL